MNYITVSMWKLSRSHHSFPFFLYQLIIIVIVHHLDSCLSITEFVIYYCISYKCFTGCCSAVCSRILTVLRVYIINIRPENLLLFSLLLLITVIYQYYYLVIIICEKNHYYWIIYYFKCFIYYLLIIIVPRTQYCSSLLIIIIQIKSD